MALKEPMTTRLVNETVATRVAQYVALRDKLAEMKEKYEAAKRPLEAAMEEINGLLQQFLDDSGSESIRTKFGTCYSSVRYTASLPDAKAFMDYVIQSERYELLDRKANSTAVRAFVEEAGDLPPGCKLTALRTVGVRRGKGEKDDD